MSDVLCTSVLGHDGLVHALDGNGYCLCGMGRKNDGDKDLRDLYGNWLVGCLECLARQDGRPHFVALHYGI